MSGSPGGRRVPVRSIGVLSVDDVVRVPDDPGGERGEERAQLAAAIAGEGRVNAVTRRDLAEAAVAVLLGDDHAGKVYELGGDAAFTLAEFAAEITDVTGTPVVYNDLPAADYVAVLASFGLPQPIAELLADSDQSLKRGELLVEGDDLRTLIGRPTTTPAEAIREAVSA
ncbi:Rossmann-fold NAD(P)-binding domain-containing protein [Microbacterium algeriense]|uniref:hypothetical protein n=1 Tax=Microbacterium algeriense TaxID=2615184 RepID=UPI0029A7ADC4|nr:hypothetical protein [Microbacterium algeriense]MDX2399456.1 hypothetical protein [Microbacterium algeriense]